MQSSSNNGRKKGMSSFKELYEENKAKGDRLTKEMLATLNPDEEYVKDNEIYCKKCNTPRTIFAFTQKVRTRCKCQKEAWELKEKQQMELERKAKIEKLKEASLLGKKYKSVSFDNTDTSNQDFAKIFGRCKRYCEVVDQVLDRGLGIYMFGNAGTGKTRLTACMANELMDKGYMVIFTNFSEISKQIRSSYDNRGISEAGIMDKLLNADFLFIDDLGTEMLVKDNQDKWIQQKIYEVINGRYNNNKPIIITSNHSLSELMSNRGLSPKTLDRIVEMCEPMKLDGVSYRLKARKSQAPIF